MTTAAFRPPRRWELQTLALSALIGVSMLLGLALIGTHLEVRHQVLTHGTAGVPGWTRSVLDHAGTVDTVYLVLVIAYLAALYWWVQESRGILLIFGDGDLDPLRSPWLLFWRLFIFLAVLVRIAANTAPGSGASDTEVAGWLEAAAFGSGLRVVALLCVALGVWQVRNSIHRALTIAAARSATDSTATDAPDSQAF